MAGTAQGDYPWRQAIDEASSDRIGGDREYDWNGACHLKQRCQSYAASGYDNVRCERDQLRCIPAKAVGIAPAPACFNPHIATVGPPQTG
jgi:hypothetical protein